MDRISQEQNIHNFFMKWKSQIVPQKLHSQEPSFFSGNRKYGGPPYMVHSLYGAFENF